MLATFIQRAVMQGIPLLFSATGEILTEKSSNLNLGIPGIMYVGGISGVIGAFFYESSLLLPRCECLSGYFNSSALQHFRFAYCGLIYCFLTVTLRANQNVTGLAITTFGVGFGNFFGGSLIKLVDTDIPSISLTTTSNFSGQPCLLLTQQVGLAKYFCPTDFSLCCYYNCSRMLVLPQQNPWRFTSQSSRRKSRNCRCRRYQRWKDKVSCYLYRKCYCRLRRSLLCNGLCQRCMVKRRFRRQRLACNCSCNLCYVET